MVRRPSRSCTSAGSAGTLTSATLGMRGGEPLRHPGVVLGGRGDLGVHAQRGLGDPRGLRHRRRRRRSRPARRRRPRRARRSAVSPPATGSAVAGAVDDDAGQRHLRPRRAVRRSTTPRAARPARAPRRPRTRCRALEQLVGVLRALAETAEHRLERADEGRQVVEQIAADDLGERAGDDAHADAVTTFRYALPPAFAGAVSSLTIRPSRKRPSRFGRVQEVERRARRRRVDDDEIPLVRRRRAGRASPSPCTPACPANDDDSDW